MQKFFELNREKARELIALQIIDGWTYDEVTAYFYALGYDIFFVRSVINPFFINPTK